MTLQSGRILRLLRHVEIRKGCSIYIDYEEKTFSTVHESSESFKTLRYNLSQDELQQILNYLCKKGSVTRSGNFGEYLTLSHEASRIWQYRISLFCKSVFLPILVSFATAVITVNIWPTILNWLQHL